MDVANGQEIATAIYPYSHSVMDEYLPESDMHLEPDWALQYPEDTVRVFQNTVSAVLIK